MIQLQGIQRRFEVGDQSVHALDDVSLNIARGDYVAIMGPSGSGKSTLLHVVGLLDRPDSGEYTLSDRNVTTLTDNELAHIRRNQIGFVFQFFHLVPRLSAAQNIELPLVLAGVPPERRTPVVARALEEFGLADRARHRPDQLSGGQRQRVAIARATVMEPSLLLADEPTGNLDRNTGIEVIRILEDLTAKGITLIMVTHDPELGERARRRIHMRDGHVVEDSDHSHVSG